VVLFYEVIGAGARVVIESKSKWEMENKYRIKQQKLVERSRKSLKTSKHAFQRSASSGRWSVRGYRSLKRLGDGSQPVFKEFTALS
jgi:hypothetical protein